MSYEQELKYTLPTGLCAKDVFSHPEVAPFLSGEIQEISMSSTYFDTPDGILETLRCALRLRMENSTPIVTLKTAISSDGAFSKRGEWEVCAAAIPPALPLLIQAGAPPEIIDRIVGQPLCVVAQFSFLRSQALLSCKGFTASLCVDIGYLSPDGIIKIPLHEVELELRSGDSFALQAKGEQLCSIFSMQCETRSKLCRARNGKVGVQRS